MLLKHAYRSSFATLYTRAECSKTFGDLGQTFAPLGILYERVHSDLPQTIIIITNDRQYGITDSIV